MKTVHTQLLDIMTDYLSGINARSLVRRALEKSGNTQGSVTSANLPDVINSLRVVSHLFVGREHHAEMFTRLEALAAQGTGNAASRRELIAVQSEGDIVVARSRARELCEAIGSNASATHKVATVVSELARNIVSYTHGGSIELLPQAGGRSILVRAKDSGPGIRNLEEILSGKYRSSTGLGLGIAGSKRLSTSFDVKTGSEGTTIEATLAL
jgi:serine/threonine-protein kinase RsbT